MKTKFLSAILVVLTLFSCQIRAQDWALTDANDGWNTPDLVRLYFHNSELQTQWAFRALSHYQFSGNEQVLDFGSGDGKLSAIISFFVPKGSVTGIDISKEMVSFATKMFPNYAYPNLHFALSEHVDFERNNLKDHFDLVTSFCVFHVVPNAKIVLKKLHEKMKPSAKLVVTYPIGGNLEFFKAAADEMAVRGWSFPPPTSDSQKMRDPERASEIITDAGFTIEYFKIINTRTPFSTKVELVDWLEGTLSANWNVPSEGRREFFIDVAERYLKYRPQDAGDNNFVYFSLSVVDFVATPQ